MVVVAVEAFGGVRKGKVEEMEAVDVILVKMAAVNVDEAGDGASWEVV